MTCLVLYAGKNYYILALNKYKLKSQSESVIFYLPSTRVLMKISKILVAGLAATCLTVSAVAEVANPVSTLTPIGVTRAAFLGGTVGFVGNQAAISSPRRKIEC